MHRTKLHDVVDTLLISLFLIVCVTPLLVQLLAPAPAAVPSENRVLQAAPPLPKTPAELALFPRAFDLYYRDHFGLRSPLLRMHSFIHLRGFGVSPSSRVLKGRSGWYFLGGETDAGLASQLNRVRLSDALLEEWTVRLRARKRWLNSLGSRHLLVVVPNRHTVYSEFLPPGFERPKQTQLDQLLAHIRAKTDVVALDLRPAMQRAKQQRGLVYHRTDTHWNEAGAFVAYEAIMDRVQEWFPKARRLRWEQFEPTRTTSRGLELAMLMGAQEILSEHELVTLAPRRPLTITDRSQPSCWVFADSFGINLAPFLKRTFPRLNMSLGAYRQVNATRPDVFIDLFIERKLTAPAVITSPRGAR